ncbi:MAG: 2-phosphosulfolactate phosphatase [Deltaproteobacteria bacterium]|nr:2-phosphosulfolactate phosphatase [Deltaproteobacteria bacterium]
MEIHLASLLEGARQAEGTVVIVDVLRAFTTAAVALARGAAKIILVAEVEDALALRRRGAGDRCMGEVGGQRPPGFDYGNSPFELSAADISGLTLIQSTRAGTVGAVAARRAERIFAASLVNAAATAAVLHRQPPPRVTIVAMGMEGKVRADEDELCALYLRNLLEGRQPDRDALRRLILGGAEAQKYGDPARPHFHPQDRALALQIDTIALAMAVSREDGLLVARALRV